METTLVSTSCLNYLLCFLNLSYTFGFTLFSSLNPRPQAYGAYAFWTGAADFPNKDPSQLPVFFLTSYNQTGSSFLKSSN